MARSPKNSEVTPQASLQSRVVRETVVAPKKGRRAAARPADAPPDAAEAAAAVKRKRARPTPEAALAPGALPAVSAPEDGTVLKASRLEQIRTRASRLQPRPRKRTQAEESVEAKIAAIAAAARQLEPEVTLVPAEAPPLQLVPPVTVAEPPTTEAAVASATTEAALAHATTEAALAHATTEAALAQAAIESTVAPEAILEETPLALEPPVQEVEAPAVPMIAPAPAALATAESTAPIPASWEPPAEARPPEPSTDAQPAASPAYLPIAESPSWLAHVPRRAPPPRPTQRPAPTVLTPVRWVVSRLLRWAGL